VPIDQPLANPPACPSPMPSPRTTDYLAAVSGLSPVHDYAQEFCSGPGVPPSCPAGAVPAGLRRPIAIPSIQPGAQCPVTAANGNIWSKSAPGLGPGPVAPVGLGPTSTLRYGSFSGYPSHTQWGGQKVLWVAAGSYTGPILIRGMQVDGHHGVGFNVGGPQAPLVELQLPPGSASDVMGGGRWRGWPSYTRVQAPGCYAYQVDGTDFSYVLVFRVRP
jgi:hypothetical protein